MIAVALMLGLGACGDSDGETDTEVEADSDTATDSGTDADTEADTDTDTTDPTLACDTCLQSAEEDISGCTSQCFSDFEVFCDREMCRMSCIISGRYDEVSCQDNAGAACDEPFDRAQCRADCLGDWEVCTTGSVCPQGNSGNCLDTWSSCDAGCWSAR